VTAVKQSAKPQKASKPTASAASPKNVFSWMLLGDAFALITDAYQDWRPAQRILCRALGELRVRVRAARAEGPLIKRDKQAQWEEYDHNLQVGDLWSQKYFGPDWTPYSTLQIHWQESSATLELDVEANPMIRAAVEPPGGRRRPVTVTFFRIEVAREDLLNLLPEGYELPFESPLAKPPQVSTLPEAAPARSKGLKRGQKGYSEEELKPFELKFYELLYENDVKAGAEISIDRYAEDLMDWGKRNELRTPGRTKMTGQIEKWRMTWLEYKSFNK
jgi:hypothetical protein